MRWLLLCLVLCVVIAKDLDSADYKMAMTPTMVNLNHEDVSSELVNGGFAGDAVGKLNKGPKVNGGFAVTVPVRQRTKLRKVSNADCAGGRLVDGRCVHPFPKPARKATVQDNMASPEQQSEASYEADIHQFVKKHFGQEVMEDTPRNTHHVGMPGQDVIKFEMNKNPNTNADGAAEALFPVGSAMMTDGDQEMNVDLSHAMSRHPKTRSLSSPPSTQESAGSSALGDLPTVEASSDSQAAPLSPPLPPLTKDAEELAEPAAPAVNVPEEDGDLEAIIPKQPVKEEEGLPPTPTPTPTPDLEKLRRIKEQQEQHKNMVDTCIANLAKEDIVCTNTPAEAQAMSEHAPSDQTPDEPQANVQTDAVALPQRQIVLNVTAFDVHDEKANLQELIVYCTQKTIQALSPQMHTPSVSTARAQLTQALVKYSSVLMCLDSEHYPSCVPAEAMAVVRQPPSNGDWGCF